MLPVRFLPKTEYSQFLVPEVLKIIIIGSNSSYLYPLRFSIQFRFSDQVGQGKKFTILDIKHAKVLAHLCILALFRWKIVFDLRFLLFAASRLVFRTFM